MSQRDQVIICGAGPVGMVAALLLSRAGVPVTLVEAEQAIVPSPRAIAYQHVTAEVLDRAGLLPEVLAEGFTRQTTHFRTREHGVVAETDFSLLGADTPYPYVIHLAQHVLAAIVLRHLRTAGVPIMWDTRLTGITQAAAGLTAEVEGPGGISQLQGAWLIGADGARSAVRKACGLGFEGHTWPDLFVATNVFCDFEARGFARANYIHDPEHWAVITKISRDGLWRVVYGEHEETPEDEIRPRLDRHFSRIIPADLPYRVEMCAAYRVHQRSAERYRAGRVLLAGDAAHITNPMGGLGLTTGLLDAAALADALAAVIHRERGEEVLDEYAEDRRDIFLNIASPKATEAKRKIMESDPDRRAADIASLRRLGENKKRQRESMLSLNALKGKAFAVRK